jgi:Rrf2 family protein
VKLTKRSEYGLRALLDLANQIGQEPVPLKDLAQRNNLPLKFSEQIFTMLVNAGLLQGQPGPGGGYRLGRDPGQITLGEVIRALDGTIAPVNCTSRIAYEPCSCPDERTCLLRAAMEQVRASITEVVDYATLASVLEDSRRSPSGPA